MPRCFSFLLVATAALAVAAGCTTNVEKESPNAPPAAVSPSPPSPGPAAPTATPPGPGPAAPAVAPEPAPAAGGSHAAQLKEVEKREAAYQKNPGDAAAKSKLIAVKYEYATKLMDDANVDPRQKYRPALKQYNDILKLQPSGYKDSAGRKKAIEDIYRSMGMPVPQ